MMDDKEFTVRIKFKPIERSVKVMAGDEIEAERKAAKIMGPRRDRIAEMKVECKNYHGDGQAMDSDWYPIDDQTREFWDFAGELE